MNTGDQPRDHRDISIDGEGLDGVRLPDDVGNTASDSFDDIGATDVGEGAEALEAVCECATRLDANRVEYAAAEMEWPSIIFENNSLKEAVDVPVSIDLNCDVAECLSIKIHDCRILPLEDLS